MSISKLFDDDELITLLESDDKLALDFIYLHYWEELYLTAFSIIRDSDPCKDIVQDVLLQLWLRRNDVRINSLKSYLHTAVRYKVLTYIKSASNRKVFVEPEELEMLAGADVLNDQLHQKDIEKLLEEGIALLPARCKEVFVLSRFEHLSHKEVAERMGISVKTVEAQMTLALRQLRIVLGEVLFLACVSIVYMS